MLVSFAFEAIAGIAPLAAPLQANTSVYNEWPPKHLRVRLPEYHRIATAVPDGSLGNLNGTLPTRDHVFMSTPIHVRDGDFLSVTLRNSLPGTGLSLHWHGFEMTDHLEYDGVTGITQCPISPDETFTYAWEVKETPGTYWYHTHSGHLGIDADNAIMGPLIVHPKIQDEASLFSDVPFLNPAFYESDSNAQQKLDFSDLLFYGNERILFFKDGFLHSGERKLLEMAGGLNPPISYDEDSFGVGTYPWNFGTCNGKLREVVPVSPGQTLKFRLLNAGSMYALRISFDGLKMTILAADSEPVEPVVAIDEIIMHTAERFDVEITIPQDAEVGSTSWIRADTLESQKQGYQNGIRAIIYVVDWNETSTVDPHTIPDPQADVETKDDHNNKITYNCHSHTEAEQGGCFPVSALSLKDGEASYAAKTATETASAPVEAHVIDWQFSPQFAHFVRIDGGKWNQHAMHQGHSMLLPDYDASTMLHPHAAVLNVQANVRAILIWRNRSTMNHPIHLHGRKMEILDELVVKKSTSCNHQRCELSDLFTSEEAIQRLASIPAGTRPLKDTFILPAGGAVATRIFTGEPALWFVHCHLDAHREDGMAMILNVGNYQAPSSKAWLPSDYPKCDTPFLLTKQEHPACNCYINADAILDGMLTKDHMCSREYLCFHQNSPQANIEDHPYESNGIALRSQYSTPGWAISLIIVILIVFVSNLIAYRRELFSVHRCGADRNRNVQRQSESRTTDGEVAFKQQFMSQFNSQWHLYRPTCVSLLRTAEVTSLAFFTGGLFYEVGEDATATGFGSINSLLFFSVTLWTFTRMYPAIPQYYVWRESMNAFSSEPLAIVSACLARCCVVFLCESGWPFIYVFVCFPIASMAGSYHVLFKIGLLLSLNNICYVSIGSVLGTVVGKVPRGMIISTIVAQSSLVAAGFYTEVPNFLVWMRYMSPVFWAYRGIVKSAFNWSDTFHCRWGSTLAGVNSCFIEMHPSINNLKNRGINVATFGDDQSSQIGLEVTVLLVCYFCMQSFIVIVYLFRQRLERKHCDISSTSSSDNAGSKN